MVSQAYYFGYAVVCRFFDFIQSITPPQLTRFDATGIDYAYQSLNSQKHQSPETKDKLIPQKLGLTQVILCRLLKRLSERHFFLLIFGSMLINDARKSNV